MTTNTPLLNRIAANRIDAERSMHDDALNAFREQYLQNRIERFLEDHPEHDRTAVEASMRNASWALWLDTPMNPCSYCGSAHPNTGWAERAVERCGYCGVAASAVTPSDILVCAGHADMRTDRYIEHLF